MTLEYGDPNIALPNEILRTVVGSGVHGIAVQDQDDHDEMGIFIEPESIVIGLDRSQDHYVWRTRNEGERSGPSDTDLIIYSLRKWLRLAIKGNPTVLIPLFCPDTDIVKYNLYKPLGIELRNMRDAFLSQEAAHRILGYMDQQRRGMLGLGGAKIPSRPELVEKYGYDTKYASHALRLAIQGFELAAWGRLTLPMDREGREAVLSVKTGQIPREKVIKMVEEYEIDIRELLDGTHPSGRRTPLPPKPDRERISAWSISAHRQWWDQ